MRRTALVYAGGRFGLFALVALILWTGAGAFGAHLNGLPLLLLAALVSSALGYVLFARQRDALARALDGQRRAKVEQADEGRARIERES